CVLRQRPPRDPTLFPYTTLFRSELGHRLSSDVCWALVNIAVRAEDASEYSPIYESKNGVGDGEARRRLDCCGRSSASPREPCRSDRKSTRLNSSHVSISYAVFCL